MALIPRWRRYRKPIERPWDWIYTIWSKQTRERVRRRRRDEQRAWLDFWHRGPARGLAIGTVMLAVGLVLLIGLLVPTGLVSAGVCVRSSGCVWSDADGVRVERPEGPVTVMTR